MHSNLKKGLFLVTFLGMTVSPGISVMAADGDTAEAAKMPGVGIEAVLKDFYSQNREIKAEDYLVPENKGEYLDMAFANVTSFLYVRSEPTKESEYVGKLYPGYAAKITGPVGEWTAVESGDVTGYVKTEYILTGAEAQTYAENLVTEAQQEGKEEAEAFTYAVSRKSEEAQMTQEVQGECTADGDYRGFRTAGVKWTGDRRLCMPVYWESVCLGRHKSDRWGRLFRICTVCICTFWNQSSTDNV